MQLIANWHLDFKSLDVKALNIHVSVILLCYFIIGTYLGFKSKMLGYLTV